MKAMKCTHIHHQDPANRFGTGTSHPRRWATKASRSRSQIADYVKAAKAAIEECGFDGVEVHGEMDIYLSNSSVVISTHADEYGGSPEKRCNIVLELMDALAEAIGEDKLASPSGWHLSDYTTKQEACSERRRGDIYVGSWRRSTTWVTCISSSQDTSKSTA